VQQRGGPLVTGENKGGVDGGSAGIRFEDARGDDQERACAAMARPSEHVDVGVGRPPNHPRRQGQVRMWGDGQTEGRQRGTHCNDPEAPWLPPSGDHERRRTNAWRSSSWKSGCLAGLAWSGAPASDRANTSSSGLLMPIHVHRTQRVRRLGLTLCASLEHHKLWPAARKGASCCACSALTAGHGFRQGLPLLWSPCWGWC
jgi:hypothetical protein